jgi:hypothetical protein
MSNKTFMLEPELVAFKANQLSALNKHLDEVEQNTEVTPIASVDELTLDRLGRTDASRSRVTTTAIAEICRQACPGLFKTISSLSGLISDEKRQPCLAEMLVVYCLTIKARFDDTLADKSLIKDIKKNRIDGIIGSGYQYLSNKHFFDLVQTSIEHAVPSLTFQGAELLGRTIVITYRQDKPIQTKPDTFYSGIYFMNSELGDHSVKAANILVQPKTNFRAASSLYEGRVVHSGKDFKTRVAKTLHMLINKHNSLEPKLSISLSKGLLKLPELPLGLAKLKPSEAIDRAEELVTRLCRKKISNQHAERVIYSALNWGSDSVQPSGSTEAQIRRETWGGRTAYDLFIALVRDASSRSMSYRLSLERVAYDLALGKISIIK